ncbi:Thiamin-phosphate pyrophosphorylase [hydrothermal vent metagenome]|uniref:Thiamin-phosphate pyrophosphorylase n=1 Tax=hydrothermal vent metagenome TaxID=652676 RepID=A0A3B1E6H2_9ZZZZ
MLRNKIYALCDIELLKQYNLSIKQYINQISNYNIVLLQYRDKINHLTIQKQNLQILKMYTNIKLIINDKIELLEYADGLHLGQEDIENLINIYGLKNKEFTIKFLKKKYPNKIFGLSTHNEMEILEANKLDLDYIGLGAYRDTNTKSIKNILGDNISYLAKISKHPVGAIGGVRLDDTIDNVTYNVIGSGLL